VVKVFSPAKINLYLAVTGRRADGFHDLVSVAAPLELGDELTAEASGRQDSGPGRFKLECDAPEVPTDDSNLILKAAEAFATATGWQQGVTFKLTKRIPLGAGLGGGSSNAVAALRALNQLAGRPLTEANLAGIAAKLGSDCALFLKASPVVMRGRGEQVEVVPDPAVKRIRGRRVLLFKPGFAISTAWAYGRMARRGTDYLAAEEAGARVADWLRGDAPAEALLFNNMEGPAFEKFEALPILLGKLRRACGLEPRLSGSGSACFALLGDDFVTAPAAALIRECWGASAFVRETRLA
jgi:4-diphosphocytidyl-2-C-methyl-D-erythritol kinase